MASTVINWYGGKGQIAHLLLPFFPPHHTYCEPFGGGATMLLAKGPSPVEVYNDLDSGLVNFFRVLRDPERFERFHRMVSCTPYSREEHELARSTLEEGDEVERAWKWFVVARQSFSGLMDGGWSYSRGQSRRGQAMMTSGWMSAIDRLPEVHERLMRVQIEHRDFEQVIRAYDTEDTLFYCDPPYVLSTRRGAGYRHEMSDADHVRLVECLLGVSGKVLLSGYQHEIYAPLQEAGWVRKDFGVRCRVLSRSSGRVESLYLSPNAEQQCLQALC